MSSDFWHYWGLTVGLSPSLLCIKELNLKLPGAHLHTDKQRIACLHNLDCTWWQKCGFLCGTEQITSAHTLLLLMPAGIMFMQLKGLNFLFWDADMTLRLWYPGFMEVPGCSCAVLLMSHTGI